MSISGSDFSKLQIYLTGSFSGKKVYGSAKVELQQYKIV